MRKEKPRKRKRYPMRDNMYDPIFKIWKSADIEKRMMMVQGLEEWIARQPIAPKNAIVLLQKMLDETDRQLDKNDLS